MIDRSKDIALAIQCAAKFTAVLFLGHQKPGSSLYARREADTLDAARSIARSELVPLAEFGRKPMIYAISKSGLTTHIE